jgi:hypothetical protein
MQTESILFHAHAIPQKGGVKLTIEFGSQAAATLTLRPGEVEKFVTVIDQALGADEDDDTEPLVVDADG